MKMKKFFRTAASLFVCMAVLTGLCSCSMIQNIKERARIAGEMVILDSPEDSVLADEFDLALAGSLQNCESIDESVSFKVNKPSVEAEDSGADILKANADMLKKLIMEDSPGSSERTLTPDDISDTLLKDIDISDVVSASSERNKKSETVTDENGKDVKDDEGELVKREVIADNNLTALFAFYTENTYTETDENGEEREVTEIIPADSGIIEKYFGELYDRDEIMAQLDAIKEYLQVNDYNIEYTDCKIKAKTDMDADEFFTVTYEKNFKVTANVTGVGSLSHIGDIIVTFTGSEITDYTFNYPEEDL